MREHGVVQESKAWKSRQLACRVASRQAFIAAARLCSFVVRASAFDPIPLRDLHKPAVPLLRPRAACEACEAYSTYKACEAYEAYKVHKACKTYKA